MNPTKWIPQLYNHPKPKLKTEKKSWVSYNSLVLTNHTREKIIGIEDQKAVYLEQHRLGVLNVAFECFKPFRTDCT